MSLGSENGLPARTTAAEQLYGGRLELSPTAGVDKRLYVDLDVCCAHNCEECSVCCSYFYHPDNIGVMSVLELASYALVCRRCSQPHCVNACPKQALEQQPERGRILVRHMQRCVGCTSCSLACPYGTICPRLVPVASHNCDFCLGRRDEPHEPMCVSSCLYGALKMIHADLELDENTFLVGNDLIVHSTHWQRAKV